MIGKCDVCGREVFSCTFVNGMKFCAKCYQETFGETDKDRKLANLEAKLAEYEKFMKDNEWNSIEEMQETLNKCEKEYFDIQNQLAEKEKERELDNSFWKQECDSLQNTLVEKEKEIDNLYDRLNSKQKFYEMSLEKDYKEYLSRLDKLEKQCDKDKSSFTIEQLEKVKSAFGLINSKLDKVETIKEYIHYIDHQINELKEMK